MDFVKERLNIPYIKLKFVIHFPGGAPLPEDKVSALRGGMGEALLCQHCVSDRKCPDCYFQDTCIVRMTMYTMMKKRPAFMQGDDSVGYLLECEDRRTWLGPDDELCFYLILFGRNIEYFSLYLNAFYQLGFRGIGKGAQQFGILRIETEERKLLLSGNNVTMQYFKIHTLEEYARRRLRQLKKRAQIPAAAGREPAAMPSRDLSSAAQPMLSGAPLTNPNEKQQRSSGNQTNSAGTNTLAEHTAISSAGETCSPAGNSTCRIVFHSPLNLKYQGQFIRSFSAEAILPALFRRIQMLDYFTENYLDSPKPESFPPVRSQHAFPCELHRYSSTQDKHITMHGIKGEIVLEEVSEDLLVYLLAGELLHIGKNTSFGFGRYRVELLPDF